MKGTSSQEAGESTVPRSKSLGTKLMVFFLAVGLLPLAIVGILAYTNASSALHDSESGKLEALGAARTTQISNYSTTIGNQMLTFAVREDVVEALERFTAAYGESGADTLGTLYKGSGGELDDAGDGSAWSAAHAEHNPLFRQYQQAFEYYDVFLFDTEGNLVYSMFKEPDFATNFTSGPYADSGLGEAYRGALSGGLTWTDFAPYAPSAGAAAAFVAAPVVDAAGVTIGVASFQMPIGVINSIMQDRTGLGESGETYLVGPDFLLRSDSRFSEESTILELEIDTDSVHEALAGGTDVWEIEDYRGISVLSAYSPVHVFGQDWALVAEIDSAEAFAASTSMRNSMVMVAVIVALLVLLVAFFVSRSITTPVKKVAETAELLATVDLPALRRATVAAAEGDLTATVKVTAEQIEVSTSDEIGQMGHAFNNAISEVQAAGAAFQEMMEGFRTVIAEASTTSTQVQAGSTNLASASSEAANAAIEVANSINSVADGATNQAQITDQLTEAVRQIVSEIEATSLAVGNATKASTEALDRAREGGTQISSASQAMDSMTATFSGVADIVDELGSHSEKVQDIVELIGSIAGQTNLLALNAAIEAARAGEAGRGFAVVASEVKALAEESTSSTEEITSIVAQMRDSVSKTIEAMRSGREEIEQGAHIVATAGEAFQSINEAVEHIGRQVTDVSEAAGRIETVTGTISSGAEQLSTLTEGNSAAAEEVAATSEETAAASEEVGATSEELSGAADRLSEAMSRFTT